MSATTASIELAPINLRLRLAVSALLVSWALAAVFIVLGWKVSRADVQSQGTPATQMSTFAPSSPSAVAL